MELENLGKIDRIAKLSGTDFQENYFKPQKPVIITDMCHQWAGYSKWNLEYFKTLVGNQEVPLHNNIKSDPHTPVNRADLYMKFGEYLDLIAKEPTQLRVFLFNLFHYAPQLLQDFGYPEHLMKGFLKKYPMLFFGGSGSIVHMHYDMDLSHIFLTQFVGKKKVILYPPEESNKLYKLPFMVQTFIDIENPDYAKYPAFREAKGYECVLNHGETLFMPAGYWHYMYYIEGGFAVALRANPLSLNLMKGIFNLFVIRNLDNFIKKRFGQIWYNLKERIAFQRANRVLKNKQLV